MTARSDAAASAAASLTTDEGDEIAAAVLELVRRIRIRHAVGDLIWARPDIDAILTRPRCSCRPLPFAAGPSYDDPACPLHALSA